MQLREARKEWRHDTQSMAKEGNGELTAIVKY